MTIDAVATDWIRMGSVAELAQGPKVVKGVVAFAHEGGVFAVENRCPHMGFPLHLGSVCDGILTCHWHHARFDVDSGGTLDPWADDVPAHEVRVEDGVVYASVQPKRRKDAAWHLRRLREGIEQNLALIIAKSVVSLMSLGVPDEDIAKVGLEYGTTYRSRGFSSGLTILTANLNVLQKLDAYGRMLALFQGLVHVARDCDGQPVRHVLEPLPPTNASLDRVASWYRNCIEVRDTDGAERVLHTAVNMGASNAELADMMVAAATDHFYLDGGHILDFHNKALEALARVPTANRAVVLTSLLPALANLVRSEEQQNWQTPVDLVTPLRRAFARLSDVSKTVSIDATYLGTAPDPATTRLSTDETVRFDEAGQFGATGQLDEAALLTTILGDDPQRTVSALTAALAADADPARLAQIVVLAAAKRIVHFHTQNEFSDWIAVLHTFTHAHAVHERVRQSSDLLTFRAVYHAAMRIYLDRFLNVPSSPAPSAHITDQAGYGSDLAQLLALTDSQQRVSEAANWVAQYVTAGQPIDALWNTLGHLLLREDADFHSFQCYEAVVAEYDRWQQTDSPLRQSAQHSLLYALTRYLAAHAPTARELPTVARIAWRLHRGDKVFADAPAP